MSKNIAIILSGGTGTRLGSTMPKQYIEVGGKPIIMYCVETIAAMPEIDEIVICLADEWMSFMQETISSAGITKPIHYSQPGEVRQLTILNALELLAANGTDKNAIVVIHDSARPLVSAELIKRCIDGCQDADGVLPVLPVKDTLYLSRDHKEISGLLKRSEVVAGQAPEAFRLGAYLDIHHKMTHDEILAISGSTEIAYKNGMRIALVEGEERNFKITTAEDLDNFKHILGL